MTTKRNLFAYFIVIIVILFSGSTILNTLEPPTREQIEKYKRDSTLAERIEAAKATGNHLASPDLIKQIKYRQQRDKLKNQGKSDDQIRLILGAPEWSGMPSSGDTNMMVLLIAFSDKPPNESAADIKNKIFGSGLQSDYPYESLTNYYNRSSYGQLKISGNVLGWYTTDYPMSDVGTGFLGREKLIREVIDYYDAQGHDFTQYDTDGDGVLDSFAVIWTGEHGEWSSFWWAQYGTFQSPDYEVDGKMLRYFSWQYASRDYPTGTFHPGTLIHETGHALGLPDLYDYDDTVGPDGGVGGLGMMDNNYGDHNSFSKYFLGWLQPTIISSGTHSTLLNPAGTTKDVLLIMPGATEDTLFGEYFLVQNRHRVGNDTRLPGEGLLIFHIDSRLKHPGDDFFFNNSYTSRKMVRLMEADGLEEIELLSALVDAGDYYTPGTEFGPNTIPDSKKNDGDASGIFVTDISTPAEQITFSAGIGAQVQLHLTATTAYEYAWFLKRKYAIIEMHLENTHNVPIDKFVFYRKDENNQFQQIKEITQGDIKYGTFQFTDMYPESSAPTIYRAIATDPSGEILSTSLEITPAES
ncbi:MAG: M6 family metalloprotease domain-containing protein [bacterium]|nr:M6 family metalloprotease domain-containing protein [bacterium]